MGERERAEATLVLRNAALAMAAGWTGLARQTTLFLLRRGKGCETNKWNERGLDLASLAYTYECTTRPTSLSLQPTRRRKRRRRKTSHKYTRRCSSASSMLSILVFCFQHKHKHKL